MDELLAEFLTETGEGLDQLDVELVRFEQEPNDFETLNTIFRLVHTVKGTCGFLGLTRLSRLAHAAETLMGQYRDGAPVTVDGVSAILASIDRIKQILEALERDGAEPAGSDADLIGKLQAIALADADSLAGGAAIANKPSDRLARRGCLPCMPRSTSSSGLGGLRPGLRTAPQSRTRTVRPIRTARSTAPARRPCASPSTRSNI